ncbi:MAG: response regulator transcription factor, partial [Anaerolineales bacterium]|nr:response regulator transcription factor [Anaerolineales bacterium]
ALANVSDSELLGWRLNEGFTYARLLLAQQRYADSLWVLQRLEHAAQAADVRWILYRARLWQAVVCHQSGRLPQALTILDELLAQTSRIELNPARLYLEPGEPARVLLVEARRRGLRPQHVALLLAKFPPESLPYQGAELPEALTARELDVLRLMAEGLKNQEIGARLFITLNTIRYHTSNIFGKLGVDNRTAAVARARELGIM